MIRLREPTPKELKLMLPRYSPDNWAVMPLESTKEALVIFHKRRHRRMTIRKE